MKRLFALACVAGLAVVPIACSDDDDDVDDDGTEITVPDMDDTMVPSETTAP